MSSSRLVYSTDQGRLCPNCQQAIDLCCCHQANTAILGDGRVRIQKERQGRAGKPVLVVTGLPLTESQLKQLTSELKKKLGCGGAYKEGKIELQGEKPDSLKILLEQKGFQVKLAGG
jgi:translation initiation factor 1